MIPTAIKLKIEGHKNKSGQWGLALCVYLSGRIHVAGERESTNSGRELGFKMSIAITFTWYVALKVPGTFTA